jgi:dipeptidyl aminopeptidase/acylaminoacyl peptidase
MTRTSLLLAAAAAALPAIPAVARPMTATDMHMMHRLGAPAVSPDGRYAVFSLSRTDLAANRRSNPLYLLDLSARGADPQPLAGADDGHSAVFGPDGAIYFLRSVKDRTQLFRMPLRGTATQISDFGAEISGFKIAPGGGRVIVWADRPDCPDLTCVATTLPAKAEGSGRTYDELFVRHWDVWGTAGERSRIFAYPLVGGRLTGGGVRVTGNLVGDTPSKPFGGAEEIDLSPDGRTVFFALREAGRIEATSTNLDIFASPADGSAPPTNLTAANDATDNLPTVSPDGRTLAYVAMARPGYESDRQVVMLRDIASGQVRPLTQGWDASVGSIAWTSGGRGLIVGVQEVLEHPLYRVDVATGQRTRLTKDGNAGNAVPLADGSVLFTMNSVMAPDDIYRLGASGRLAQLTAVNSALLAQLDSVSFQKFSFAGANNDRVWGWTVKPRRIAGKLPIAFLIHGGPQGSFSNSWSYRWNPRLFASLGYGVVSVDFHGSTGYGQAFVDSIRNDWGGKPLEDLQKGLAFATANDSQLDAGNACALGASYGGYMINWIAGRWPDRFKCLVQHDGIFDNRAMAYETEELWFTEWEHGGKAYYEDPAAYERWNPVRYVQNWRTPMLVITGEKDFRVPYTQGIASFTALQRRGVPSRLLVFPDENHWVLKPKNSIQWYDEVMAWMDRWTGRSAR